MALIEVIANDRLGNKVRVKCDSDDTVGDLKKLIAAQTGTKSEKIILKKWYTIYKDQNVSSLSSSSSSRRATVTDSTFASSCSITLRDYEINDGMSLEMQ